MNEFSLGLFVGQSSNQIFKIIAVENSANAQKFFHLQNVKCLKDLTVKLNFVLLEDERFNLEERKIGSFIRRSLWVNLFF